MARSALRPECAAPQPVTTPQRRHRGGAVRTQFRIEPIDAVAIVVVIVSTAIVLALIHR
jgi:hypothetical protein